MPKGVITEYRWPSCHDCGLVFLHTMGAAPKVCKACRPAQERSRSNDKYRRDVEKVRSQALKRRYGITTEERQILLERQDGRCAHCGVEETEQPKGLHVDHCHETGRVRGLLCFNCNSSLGKLGDTVEAIERLLNYLRGTNG